jgi:hypothetical protein
MTLKGGGMSLLRALCGEHSLWAANLPRRTQREQSQCSVAIVASHLVCDGGSTVLVVKPLGRSRNEWQLLLTGFLL